VTQEGSVPERNVPKARLHEDRNAIARNYPVNALQRRSQPMNGVEMFTDGDLNAVIEKNNFRPVIYCDGAHEAGDTIS